MSVFRLDGVQNVGSARHTVVRLNSIEVGVFRGVCRACVVAGWRLVWQIGQMRRSNKQQSITIAQTQKQLCLRVVWFGVCGARGDFDVRLRFVFERTRKKAASLERKKEREGTTAPPQRRLLEQS